MAAKTAAKAAAKTAAKTSLKAAVPMPPEAKRWAGNIPAIKPGRYADGIPYPELEYAACKLILRPNHFVSRKSLFDFAKVMRLPAEKHGVKFSTDEYIDAPLQIREVLFVDTKDFRLYKNALIPSPSMPIPAR